MAGTSQKTTTVGVRVPNETLGEWQGDAQQLGMPISGYVLARAQSGAVETSGSEVGPVVYFIQAGEGGPVKIGWTQKLSSRMPALQTGSPVRLSLLRTVISEPWVESWYHREFDEQRLIGEWFTFDHRMLSLEPPSEKPTKTLRSRSILKLRSLKISDATWERWQARAGDAGVTALIVRCVDEHPDISTRLLVQVDRTIAAEEHLEAALLQVAELRVALAKKLPGAVRWTGKPPAEIDQKTHHQSGPVLASAVPVVDGNTGWSGLKGSDKKGKPR